VYAKRQQITSVVMSKRERHPVEEKSVRDAREHFADVLYAAAAGKITYITTRGRRIAAVVPISVADDVVDDAPAGESH
jgi:prevent-host-death family protein